MVIAHENGMIYFRDLSIDKQGETEYFQELWDLINANQWHFRFINDVPRYILNSKGISLHHVVISYHCGEEALRFAISNDMVVDHHNNNGLDCRIENLSLLKKVRNTSKGFYFDKLTFESVPTVSLRIQRVIANNTYQVALLFNKPFVNNKTGKCLSGVRFLYEDNYVIVFQDAELMLEMIIERQGINLSDFKSLFRFKDYRVQFDSIEPIEVGILSPTPGSFVEKDGVTYFVLGNDGEHHGYILESPYIKNWNL